MSPLAHITAEISFATMKTRYQTSRAYRVAQNRPDIILWRYIAQARDQAPFHYCGWTR
jgi:hypothetical protein